LLINGVPAEEISNKGLLLCILIKLENLEKKMSDEFAALNASIDALVVAVDDVGTRIATSLQTLKDAIDALVAANAAEESAEAAAVADAVSAIDSQVAELNTLAQPEPPAEPVA